LSTIVGLTAVTAIWPSPASAQVTNGEIETVARALRTTPVYAEPYASGQSPRPRRADYATTSHDECAGPMYIAIRPASAADEAGGDAGAALRQIALSVGQRLVRMRR
jgi:hypothetical protein